MLTAKHPKLLTHRSVFNTHPVFASANYVVNSDFRAFFNRCPHRGNKIIQPGQPSSDFRCGLHGWAWDCAGQAQNNPINLKHKQAQAGRSGLVFMDWQEPESAGWVQDLAQEDFTYSHSVQRRGLGDWRWQMEMHVDLLHVAEIHPLLNSYVDCNRLKAEHGTDWICQHHEYGWWLFVYPFTHIEWEPGCLYFSEMTPLPAGQGYDVYIHYMFDRNVSVIKRQEFQHMAEVTFDEDIQAVNRISASSEYRAPGIHTTHPLEQDIRHFYNWLEENTE